jgi:hypothetical protein
VNTQGIAIDQGVPERASCRASARRSGILIASLFALLLSGVAAADGSPPAPLAVWAIGLPNGYVIMEHQAQVVQVSADDVARGVLAVSNGTRIVITTTEPSGVAMDFRSSSHLFRAVQIDGIGRSVELGPASATIVESHAAAGRRVVTVNYRFALAPDTAPGTYAWPLELTVRSVATRELQPYRTDWVAK